ncbi:MAG TPA: hypothetical protein VH760_04395 [Gaiellaceae bacterium]
MRRARRLLRLLGNERGVSMIEVTIALVLLGIVGGAMITLLTSATAATKLARQRTIAQQAALNQIEAVRAMDYNDVGVVAGNPAGCLGVTTPTTRCPNSSYPAATAGISNGGLLATFSTQVSYVNDPGPLSYTSYANYKKIVVTVTRNSDSKQLAREVTYVAPPVRASQSNAVINARVVDYGNSTQVADVPVALATGPDAPRNDVTDASGTVLFAGLTPNPTSGPTAYYDLSLTPPTGYVTLYDTVSPKSPAHVQLSPGQTWPTALYVYRPATIYLDLRNSDGTTFVPTGSSTATLKYTRNSIQYTKNVSYTGSPVTVTTMTEGSNTVQTIPGLPYTASATGGGFYQYDPATQTVETSKTENVPDAYPTTLTHTFTLTNAPTASLSVQVTRSGNPCKGATVTVNNGPWTGTFTGTTDASTGAAAVLTVPVLPTGTTYTIKGQKGSNSRTYNGQPVSAPSTSFNVQLTSGSC